MPSSQLLPAAFCTLSLRVLGVVKPVVMTARLASTRALNSGSTSGLPFASVGHLKRIAPGLSPAIIPTPRCLASAIGLSNVKPVSAITHHCQSQPLLGLWVVPRTHQELPELLELRRPHPSLRLLIE